MSFERYIDHELTDSARARWAYPVEGTLDELVAILLMLGCEKMESKHTPGAYSVYPPGAVGQGIYTGKKLVFFEPGNDPDPSINMPNLTAFFEQLEKNDGL